MGEWGGASHQKKTEQTKTRDIHTMEGHWKKPARKVHFWPHLEPTEIQMQEHWICILIMMPTPMLTLITCVANHEQF